MQKGTEIKSTPRTSKSVLKTNRNDVRVHSIGFKKKNTLKVKFKGVERNVGWMYARSRKNNL